MTLFVENVKCRNMVAKIPRKNKQRKEHHNRHQCVRGLMYFCHIIPLGYERVYQPLFKVADTPFHIQGDTGVGGDSEMHDFLLDLVVTHRSKYSARP